MARSLAGSGLPHPLRVDAARAALARGAPGLAHEEIERARAHLLQPVVNATGVLLHTNLGRSPLAASQAATYTNLELDLDRRLTGAPAGTTRRSLLARACGAEAALVVNNGAAALLVVLAALAAGRPTRRVPRRAHRDRRRLPAPRDHGAVGQPAPRGRHDQPDAAGRLPRRRAGGRRCC